MNRLLILKASLRSRLSGGVLTILLMFVSTVIVALSLSLSTHMTRTLNDGQGIDLVIGAKGSPLQIVLSSLYHADIPTGNIAYKKAQRWIKHPQVRQAIPLALGDNWRGKRIVGTTQAFAKHYGAVLFEGKDFTAPFEAVIGANISGEIGAEFAGSHGFSMDGHSHDEHIYKVVGRYAATGTVLDNLVLTSIDSVLMLHGQEGLEAHDNHGHDAHEDHDHDHHDHADPHDDKAQQEAEITALLIKVKSPLATINLPRQINRESDLQAANPALEITRLTQMLGMGTRSLFAIGLAVSLLAIISVFTNLTMNAQARRADALALRAIGYTKGYVFSLLLLEALVLAAVGIGFGLIVSLTLCEWLNGHLPLLTQGAMPLALSSSAMLACLALLITSLIGVLWPAWRLSRRDIGSQLGKYS